MREEYNVGVVTAVLVIFGILFATIVGISIIMDTTQIQRTGIETTAVVIDFHSGRRYTHATVQFEVNGQVYTGLLNYPPGKMYKGDRVTIWYNPENPAEFTDQMSAFEYIVYAVIIVAGLGISCLILRREIRKMRE